MIRRTLGGYGSDAPLTDPTAPKPPMPSGPVQKRKLDANGGIAPPAPPLPSPMPDQAAPAMTADPNAAMNPQNLTTYTGGGGAAPEAQSPHPDLAALLQLLQGKR